MTNERKFGNRNSYTVPNTPGSLLGQTQIPINPIASSLNHLDKINSQLSKLSRIKSLGRLDLKSSFISYDATPEADLHSLRTSNTITSKILNILPDKHTITSFYNDFTTIDWVSAFLESNRFQFQLHHKHWITNTNDPEGSQTKIPLYYRIYLTMGRWVLIVMIGFVFSLVAFGIDKFEILLVGFKHGYCSTNWFISQVSCCADYNVTRMSYKNVFKSGYIVQTNPYSKSTEIGCPDWISWDIYFNKYYNTKFIRLDFMIYVLLTIVLAVLACIITLSTKISSRYMVPETPGTQNDGPKTKVVEGRIMYTAAGSGVPEVKTILSGFVIRRFLGTYTFVAKTSALILAIASGMSLGKEGPYVHLATTVGNISSRLFPFVSRNEAISKQILSAAALSGVALAFGSPLGGVLFILEEINHSLPPYQLFQIFFCAIISTLFLKFLDPYGTGNSVLFELKYTSDWKPVELIFFIFIGLAGGTFGGIFVKFTGWWSKWFRQMKLVKNKPKTEVMLIALLTGIITFWNPYTKQASAELVLDLATSCGSELDRSLCPMTSQQHKEVLASILFALIVKVILTAITFGLKVPYGIYVPSMVIGALFGRLFATFIEYLNITNLVTIQSLCENNRCIDKGIYSMIGAGAFMAGVTRMNITLVIILFEITSSYTYVLPISISIAVANWMGGYIESNSLYESILIANDYPFMAPETEPIDPFVTAGEIIEDSARNDSNSDPETKLFIDITDCPYVAISILRAKMTLLVKNSMFDGCVALLRNDVCVGLIFFSELEFCVDKINKFCQEYTLAGDIYCKVYDDSIYMDPYSLDIISNCLRSNSTILSEPEVDYFTYGSTENFNYLQAEIKQMSDLTSSVSANPIFLNHNSELSLAHLLFDKIGNRVIVLVKNGKYYGLLHKKTLIDYIRRQ